MERFNDIINHQQYQINLRLPAHTWWVSSDMWSCTHSRPKRTRVHRWVRCCSRLDTTLEWPSLSSTIPCEPTKPQLFQRGMLALPTCIGSNMCVRLCRRLSLSLMGICEGIKVNSLIILDDAINWKSFFLLVCTLRTFSSLASLSIFLDGIDVTLGASFLLHFARIRINDSVSAAYGLGFYARWRTWSGTVRRDRFTFSVACWRRYNCGLAS